MKYLTLFRGISKNIFFPPILRVKKNYIASDLDLCLTVTLISHIFIPVFQSTIFFSYDIFLTRLISIVSKPIKIVVVVVVNVVVLNIVFNIGVQYWVHNRAQYSVQYWVQYLVEYWVAYWVEYWVEYWMHY